MIVLVELFIINSYHTEVKFPDNTVRQYARAGIMIMSLSTLLETKLKHSAKRVPDIGKKNL
jgi:hypothetical protein